MMAELDILNGFAGKVISDCIDIAIDKIIKADKNRKAENQTIETRIYQVTIDALNKFPYNKYKKKEKVYDAAESILKELKRGNRIYKEAVRAGLNMLSSEVTGDICKDFLELLCYEICRKENRDLAIGHIIHQGEKISEWQQQMDRHLQEEFKESHQNEKEILEATRDIKCSLEGMDEGKSCKTVCESPIVNRAEEYAQKWNRNVFLNDFNKRDIDAGTNIKLKDIYLEEHLPHYVWKANEEPLDDLKTLLREYITDKDDRQMLLILGQPGIGKSTLITWIMANLVKNMEQILVYQFASDLGKVDWQNNNTLDEIFKAIGYSYRELEGKMLILDGFDEIQINGDRERILHKLNQELKNKNILKKFSLIITCRENYVDKKEIERIEYITLQAWDEEQIKSFSEIYEKENTKNSLEAVNSKNLEVKINKILKNKEVFGIPLILYMILALNIDIEKSSSKVDIYDQIFSLKRGGIYDRCYDVEHRINSPEIKENIHRISQRIAFWMFENNAYKASISQEKFKEICDTVMDEAKEKNGDIQRDVLIGNYFAPIKHCEGVGTDELQFVHRSIYEYFVVVYFFESIHDLKSIEKLAGKLGELLKDGKLSEQILEFIKYKFDSMKGYDLSAITKKVFNIMLQDGMTYYTKGKHKNIIIREMNIFTSMLEVVHLWNYKLGKLDNKIVFYLRHNYSTNLDLGGICLNEADLKGVNLRGANLKGANLRATDLSGADLWGADLRVADVEKADLSGANLGGADLSVADLKWADLRGVDLKKADLRGAKLYGTNLSGVDLNETYLLVSDLNIVDLEGVIFNEEQVKLLSKCCELCGSKVYISETREIISYGEYCIRKQKNQSDNV